MLVYTYRQAKHPNPQNKNDSFFNLKKWKNNLTKSLKQGWCLVNGWCRYLRVGANWKTEKKTIEILSLWHKKKNCNVWSRQSGKYTDLCLVLIFISKYQPLGSKIICLQKNRTDWLNRSPATVSGVDLKQRNVRSLKCLVSGQHLNPQTN